MNSKIEYTFNSKLYEKELLLILQDVERELKQNTKNFGQEKLRKILNKYPQDGNSLFSRGQLVAGYRDLVSQRLFPHNDEILKAIRLKPMRTQSGITPVSVLTKPFPCPGRCIFCPNDVRMPKSYLSNEPGAQRAERNNFDPYLQTYNRMNAFYNIGHSIEKIELIILGGTWSYYPEGYQIWFVKRCFDAMNDFGVYDGRPNVKTQNVFKDVKFPKDSKNKPRKKYNQIILDVVGGKVSGFFEAFESATWEELGAAQKKNEAKYCRNVGLVIETRPDYINEKELIKIRRLGGTKVQIGVQSLNDKVLNMNKRGHGIKETARAFELMRLSGFKIHVHWMPNLHGSNVKDDIKDYKKLWDIPFRPDEVKVYPTSIIKNTELYDVYKQGGYKPYSYDELLYVLSKTLPKTPRYARLTRIIRDIPSTDIVAGNKFTNFRQIVEKHITLKRITLQDIRSREVKLQEIQLKDLKLEVIPYKTTVSLEHFISYKTKKGDKIIGFLRLCWPKKKLSSQNFFEELRNCAIIREVHVYGQVVGIGKKTKGKAQHLGLGTKLIELACQMSKKAGWKKIAVISAVGTRKYYKKRNFYDCGLYLVRDIN